jgi:hypothetical protein
MTVNEQIEWAREHKRVWPKGSFQRRYWKLVIRRLKLAKG